VFVDASANIRTGLDRARKKPFFTFRYVNIDARGLRVGSATRVVARVADLRLFDDESALGAWSWYRLDGNVPPIVVVVDHAIVALPINVLRRLGTLKILTQSERALSAINFLREWHNRTKLNFGHY
jgi:hypothetical protein